MTPAQFYQKQLEEAGLVDGRFVGTAVDPDGFFGLVVQPKGTRALKARKIVWILRNEEGNCPGAINITDHSGA